MNAVLAGSWRRSGRARWRRQGRPGNSRLSCPSSFEFPAGSAGNMRCMSNCQILRYQELNALSSRMAEAARNRDWETFRSLVQSVEDLRGTLAGGDPLSEAELRRKTQLIQRILDDDAEIRRHTEPWMEQLCRLLNGQGLRDPSRTS